MEYKLSILICNLPDRSDFLYRLFLKLLEYGGFKDGIEILTDDDTSISTGAKRNKLLQQAKGKYLAFIDDDDLITEHYFPGVLAGIEKGIDCCSLKGIITDDGKNPRFFEHSITHSRYETVQRSGKDYYLRFPNHLNCIKSDIAKTIEYPDKTISEDTEWAVKLNQSGLLKTEHWIDEVIYLYQCRSDKKNDLPRGTFNDGTNYKSLLR